MQASPGTLYVVATPLGNLQDVTLRALAVLRAVDVVACEDTRRSGQLLRAHGIDTRTTSYFEHNERWKGEQILALLREGRSVALVSDAGTPGISDPGYRLVHEARSEGLPVVPVPGPSAAVAALSVCGLPTGRFLFVGFLPSKSTARRQSIQELREVKETLVFYESPVRVLDTLAEMRDLLGERPAFLCREATKMHEEYVRGTLESLREMLAQRASVKGEIVLVVGGAPDEPLPTEGLDLEAVFAELVASGLARKAAVKEAARRLGIPAREAYQKLMVKEET